MWESLLAIATPLLDKALAGGRLLAMEAVVFFVLAALIYRCRLKPASRWIVSSSLRVNLATFSVDYLLVAGALAALLAWLFAGVEQGLFGSALRAWPMALTLLLTVFVGDFIGYFRHRFEHSRLLWPAHVLHHSDADMTWLAVYRFHPLNRLSTTLIDTGALLLLGFPLWAVLANGLLRHYYGAFIHTDLPWTYGRLGKVFVSPAMHRWHHVREGQGVGSNFATVFAVFDVLFNTHYLPGPCKVPLGVNGVNDQSYTAQLLLPLTASWRALSAYAAKLKRAGKAQ